MKSNGLNKLRVANKTLFKILIIPHWLVTFVSVDDETNDHLRVFV